MVVDCAALEGATVGALSKEKIQAKANLHMQKQKLSKLFIDCKKQAGLAAIVSVKKEIVRKWC